MKYQQLIIDKKVLLAEIKVLEASFKRNQIALDAIKQEQENLISQLGDKLNKIQELAEVFDGTILL